jgi:AcrR family transcriptional regulator
MSDVVARNSAPKGISPEKVVQAAVALTGERGLAGWTIRDLAARLGVASTAIYHHLGDRAEVIERVVAQLVGEVRRPDPELEWEQWFEQLLVGMRSILLRYSGVAHWFMMHGPALPQATDIVDAGIDHLERAGFGEHSAFAYSLLLNQGVGSVVFSQERVAVDAPDGDRGWDSLLQGFAGLAQISHGMSALTESLLRPMLTDPQVSESLFRQSLRVVIRGLAAEYLDSKPADASAGGCEPSV